MYVYVYTIDHDGSMYKSYRAKPPATLDAKASVLYAVGTYLRGYAEDHGCTFDDAILNIYAQSAEIRLTDHMGEDGRMYFSTDAASWELHGTHRREVPRKSGKGWVEYQGAAYFFDGSGDLASAPIIAATNEPDYPMEGKVCDFTIPVSDEIVDVIMELIE